MVTASLEAAVATPKNSYITKLKTGPAIVLASESTFASAITINSTPLAKIL